MAEQIQAAPTNTQAATPAPATPEPVNTPTPTMEVGYVGGIAAPINGQPLSTPATPMPNKVAEGTSPTTAPTPTIMPGKPVEVPKEGVMAAPSTKPEAKPESQFGPMADTNIEKTTTTTPEGTTTVAKETPKPVVDVAARQAQIGTNLTSAYTADKQVKDAVDSGNYEAYKARFPSTNPDEAKAVDDFFNAHQPKTTDQFLDLLNRGIPLKPLDNGWLSREQLIATDRYQRANYYKNAPVETYLNAMNSGKVVPNTPAYNDVITANGGIETPEMLAAKKQYIQGIKTSSINGDMNIKSGGTPSVKDAATSISNDITKGKTETEVDGLTGFLSGNQEIKEQHDKVVALTSEVNEMNKQKQKTMRDLVKQYPGMTKGQLYQLADQRNSDIDERLFDTQIALNAAQSTLDFNTGLAEKEYSYEFQKQQQAQQYAQQTALSDKQFGQQKELAQLNNAADLEKYKLTQKDKGVNSQIVKKSDGSQWLVNTDTGVDIKKIDEGIDTSTDTPAVQMLLGSGKFTKDQAGAIRNAFASGNKKTAFAVVKNQAKNLMSGTTKTKLESLEASKEEMKNLKGLLKDFYANGGDTGIFNGTMSEVATKLGYVTDPKLVELSTSIGSALQGYRNAISGTAYSKQEGEEISKIFPGIKKGKELNDSIIKQRVSDMDVKIDTYYDNVLPGVYSSLKGELSDSASSNGGGTPKGVTKMLPNGRYEHSPADKLYTYSAKQGNDVDPYKVRKLVDNLKSQGLDNKAIQDAFMYDQKLIKILGDKYNKGLTLKFN